MEQTFRFTVQSNQFYGECLPCTPTVFNQYVDAPTTAWKISTRQSVERAVKLGLTLDSYINDSDFQKFCLKRKGKSTFDALTQEEKLLQWVQGLKESLPCFIFAVREFNPRRRKLGNITQLSGLFMFDGDHLPMDPREVFERTQVQGFPWKVRLAHQTSSGEGLRLVSEALPELGNIADNQIEMARELGLLGVVGTSGRPVVDDSCIDASRISYSPRREDIYYIDEDKLFNI